MAGTMERTMSTPIKRKKTTHFEAQPPAKRLRTSIESKQAEIEVEQKSNGSEDESDAPFHTPATSKKPTQHVRFGSEEPAAVPPELDDSDDVAAEEDDVDEDSDSDDEAPEDVSATAALKTAKTAAAAASKAADRQRIREREKRKEADARMKAQASTTRKKATEDISAKKSSKKGEPVLLDSEDDTPDLLPEELLADDIERAPTPGPEDEALRPEKKKQRKKLLFDNGPKDVQAGPVKVRVLEKTNTFLAPKALQSARDRREAWLYGRRSGKGVGQFERRIMNPSFSSR